MMPSNCLERESFFFLSEAYVAKRWISRRGRCMSPTPESKKTLDPPAVDVGATDVRQAISSSSTIEEDIFVTLVLFILL